MEDKEVEELWADFSNIPINDIDEIEVYWNGWEEGTYRLEIWDWFDRTHSKGVEFLTTITK